MREATTRHKLRFVMGMLQIAGAGLSLGIIVVQGLTALAILAVVVTTMLTAVSVMLFRRSSSPDAHIGSAGRKHGA